MKTFFHFDSRGRIRGLVMVEAPSGVTGGLVQGQPGLMVAEVENLEFEAATADENQVNKVREILKDHKVKPGSEPRCTLSKIDKAR